MRLEDEGVAVADERGQGRPRPRKAELPAEYADRLGRWSPGTPRTDRTRLGQYVTPVDVARFMATMVQRVNETVRVLDPGAGSGVLACALTENLVARRIPPRRIEITAYEVDSTLARSCESSLTYLRRHLTERGTEVTFRIEKADFVETFSNYLADEPTLFPKVSDPRFDVAIGNPPYLKLPKSDPRAALATRVVHGQPNIYSLFMAVTADLLVERGELVFITPRSFTSGPYFRRFREIFFRDIRPEWIHAFSSRKETFRRDEVLQENVILHGAKHPGWHRAARRRQVTISSSNGGGDLSRVRKRRCPATTVMDFGSREKFLFVPTSADDDRAIALVNSWKASLHGLGMEISTGPVVPFRATSLIHVDQDDGSSRVPLVWMQHVRPFQLTWPLPLSRKPQFIDRKASDRKLLVRDANYVVLRRFSAKEERRRLTAAPLVAGALSAGVIGLENHLNYIHRPGGDLDLEEVWGLTALYNSSLLDRYFRALNGSTQANATELRAIPLPDREVLREVGRETREKAPETADEIVSVILGWLA